MSAQRQNYSFNNANPHSHAFNQDHDQRQPFFAANVYFAWCPTELVKEFCGNGPSIPQDSKSKKRASGLDLVSYGFRVYFKIADGSYDLSRPKVRVEILALHVHHSFRQHTSPIHFLLSTGQLQPIPYPPNFRRTADEEVSELRYSPSITRQVAGRS
jgi:hypothetical protein